MYEKKLLISMTVALLGYSGLAQETNSATSVSAGSTTNGSPQITAPALNLSQVARPNRGEFEAGLVLGEPTGASLKYWLNNTMAVDGALGWSLDDHNDFEMHSDLLWHKFDVFRVREGELPVYIGVGGRVKFRHHEDNRAGVRVPLGVSYLFQSVPVDIFAEVAPILDFTPSTRGGISAGIGARYRF
jgi:hypothetical protein